MNENNYQKHIAEASYKNIIKNKSNTDNNLAWYEEPETVTPKIDAKSVWLDSEFIPQSPENLRWRGNLYYATINNISVAVVEKFSKEVLVKVNDRAVFYSSKLIDAIQDECYHIVITDTNGEEIPFGLKKWTIDGGIGYLSFTDGMPNYEQPFYVSGYRYCGRKLPEHMITTDGRQIMLEGYSPSEDQSIATKVYVDDEIKKVTADTERMLPPTPDTFENKNLSFVCDEKFTAKDIVTMETVDNIVLSNWEWIIDIPEFYNPGVGTATLMVYAKNAWHEAGQIVLSDVPGKSTSSGLVIDYDGDAYANSLASRGFYNSIKCHYTNSFDNMEELLKSYLTPIKFRMRYQSDSETFYSNELTVSQEYKQEENALAGTSIVLGSDDMKYHYVSGIITPSIGSTLKVYGVNHSTLKKYTFESPFEDVAALNQYFAHFPEMPYEKYVPGLECKQDFVIQPDYYNEITDVKINIYDLFGKNNGHIENTYNFRIDTKSDESDRVTSGKEIDNQIVGGCATWDSSIDLHNNNELQLLGGIYQWPEKDFSINGTGEMAAGTWSDMSWVRTSLNYSDISKQGFRYVTFKKDLSIANGVYISINDSENLTQNKDTLAYNVESMYIKIDGETDWLDAKEPYDGIGVNKDWMQGCLAAQNSTEGKIYCTFGPKPIEGTLYVRIGISYNSKIKFSGITIEKNI